MYIQLYYLLMTACYIIPAVSLILKPTEQATAPERMAMSGVLMLQFF